MAAERVPEPLITRGTLYMYVVEHLLAAITSIALVQYQIFYDFLKA